MHPPYWNIIKFSENNNDLSNTETLENFLESLGKVIDNTTKYLERNRYCAIVIGDKYENGQVVPLGFYCMNLFLKLGLVVRHHLQDAIVYEAAFSAQGYVRLICRMCGRVTEQKNLELEKTIGEMKISRFRKDNFTLYLYGVCGKCQSKKIR